LQNSSFGRRAWDVTCALARELAVMLLDLPRMWPRVQFVAPFATVFPMVSSCSIMRPQGVPQCLPQCVPMAFQLFSQCCPNALFCQSLHNVFQMLSQYVPSVFPMSSPCFPNVFRMCFLCLVRPVGCVFIEEIGVGGCRFSRVCCGNRNEGDLRRGGLGARGRLSGLPAFLRLPPASPSSRHSIAIALWGFVSAGLAKHAS
jgi:hypothetical protein